MFDTIGHWAFAMGYTKTRFIPSSGTLSTAPVTRDFNPDITFPIGSFPIQFTKTSFERRYGEGSWSRKSTGIGESWAGENLAALISHPTNPFSLSAPTATATAVRNSGPGSHVLYYDLGLVYRPNGLSLQSVVLEMMRQLGIGQPVIDTPKPIDPVKPVEPVKPAEPIKPTEPVVTPPNPVGPPQTPTPPVPTIPPTPGDELLFWVLSLTLRQLLGQGLVWLRQVYRALTKVKP